MPNGVQCRLQSLRPIILWQVHAHRLGELRWYVERVGSRVQVFAAFRGLPNRHRSVREDTRRLAKYRRVLARLLLNRIPYRGV